MVELDVMCFSHTSTSYHTLKCVNWTMKFFFQNWSFFVCWTVCDCVCLIQMQWPWSVSWKRSVLNNTLRCVFITQVLLFVKFFIERNISVAELFFFHIINGRFATISSASYFCPHVLSVHFHNLYFNTCVII